METCFKNLAKMKKNVKGAKEKIYAKTGKKA